MNLTDVYKDDEEEKITKPASPLVKRLGELMAKQNFFASQENQYMTDKLDDEIAKVREQIKLEEEKSKKAKVDESKAI